MTFAPPISSGLHRQHARALRLGDILAKAVRIFVAQRRAAARVEVERAGERLSLKNTDGQT